MLEPGMSKSQIEKEISQKGEFIQIDWLTRFLEEASPPRDVRRFVYEKLANLYEKKHMLRDAAQAYESMGMASIRYTDKIKYYIKEAEIWIKDGDFDKADKAMRRALHEANAVQKKEIYSEIKRLYFDQAKEYEKNLKRNHAVKIYEKLLHMGLEDKERQEVREKLIDLYEKLGRFKDAKKIKALM